MAHQSIMQLFGPTQVNGCISELPPVDWWFPQSVISASSKQLRCDYRLNYLLMAKWSVVCVPNGHLVRLVHFDDGPTNVVEIAQLTDQSTSAVTLSAYVELNGLVMSNKYKHIGYQIKRGLGSVELVIFDCHVCLLYS